MFVIIGVETFKRSFSPPTIVFKQQIHVYNLYSKCCSGSCSYHPFRNPLYNMNCRCCRGSYYHRSFCKQNIVYNLYRGCYRGSYYPFCNEILCTSVPQLLQGLSPLPSFCNAKFCTICTASALGRCTTCLSGEANFCSMYLDLLPTRLYTTYLIACMFRMARY